MLIINNTSYFLVKVVIIHPLIDFQVRISG